MNNDKALSKKQLSIILLILLILALFSAAVLASRLGNFNKKKDDTDYISIADDTNQNDGEDGTGEDDPEKPVEAEIVLEHNYEIFRVSYSNDTGEVTVLSGDGDKVIAPGTRWYYQFALHNTKEVTLDYELHVTATVEGTDLELPVLARLKGPGDRWVTKHSGAYVPVMDLNQIVDKGVVAGGNIAKYSFSWNWPFESGGEEADSFDTLLGNLAVENDITLTIKIWVYAWTDEIPDRPGGEPIPGTGEDSTVGVWLTLMVLSLFAFVAVLAREKRMASPVQEALVLAGDSEEKKEQDDTLTCSKK